MRKLKTIEVTYEKRTYHFLESQMQELDRLEEEWNAVMGPGSYNVMNVDIARIAMSAGIEAIKEAIGEARGKFKDERMRRLWRAGIYNLSTEEEGAR